MHFSESYVAVIVGIIIVFVLALDIGVLQRNKKHLSVSEAMAWTIFWILFALAFNLVVYYFIGQKEGEYILYWR